MVARTAGFCMGVRRALDLALDAASRAARRGDESVYTLGPLIHNRQAVEALRQRGITPARDLDDVAGNVLVVRAHGVGPSTAEEIRRRNLEVIDATCPRVMRCQRAAARASGARRQVVLAGDREHAEVEAILESASGRGVVVSGPEEAERIPLRPPVTLLSQTTFNADLFGRIARVIKRRLAGSGMEEPLEVVNTICRSTEERQREVQELARSADAVVVVGGRHSANTRRLAEVARGSEKPVFHVETPEELRPEDFAGFGRVAVTAGASTPAWITERVLERLAETGSGARRLARRLVEALLGSDVLLAVGATSVAYATAGMCWRPASPAMLLIALAYLFSAHAANRAGRPQVPERVAGYRAMFFLRHRGACLAAAGLVSVAALFLAFRAGPAAGAALLLADVLAVLYGFRIFPTGTGRARLMSLRDIPGGKDVFVALAWAFVMVVIPALPGMSFGPIDALAAGAVFALGFGSSAASGLRDVVSDRLLGMESIAMSLGQRGARVLVIALAGAAAVGTGLPAALGLLPPEALGLSLAGAGVVLVSMRVPVPGRELVSELSLQLVLVAAGPVGALARELLG